MTIRDVPGPGLPPRALAPSIALLSRWAFSPRIDWPTSRRRLELAYRFPLPPRGTRVRALVLGGVPCEELTPPGGDDARTLVYFHGGGYAIGSAAMYRATVARFAVGFAARTLLVDYRLAPEHPHPAALRDARAVWDALGVPAARVAVAGDSAGAGLALALTQSLRDTGAALPAALGLVAPWLDLVPDVTGTRAGDSGDILLRPGLMRRFASAYLAGGADAGDPTVSPLRGDLRGLPPLVVHTSEHDLLRADGEALVAGARGAGVPVEHEVLPGLWHDPHASAFFLAEPGAGAPVRMGAALRRLLG